MARSKRVRRTKRSTAVKRRSATPKLACSTPWPTIEAFLDSEEGDITIGSLGYNSTLSYTAVASDQHNMLVALVRRSGETLHQLLDRLENALGPALEDQVFVDEINGPS
jgi:hypothetical protein